MLLKELGATPELNSALLEILAQPSAPPSALADEIVRAALSDEDSLFMQRARNRVQLWIGDYDSLAASPEVNTDMLVHWEPGFPQFRNSPAFKTMLDRLGVPAYWRKHGYPRQCRPVGKADFTCD